MNPDDTPELGQVFMAPVGTPLPTGPIEDNPAFTFLGLSEGFDFVTTVDAFADSMKAFNDAVRATHQVFSATFTFVWPPHEYRALFKPASQGKRQRKAFDRALRRNNKAWRASQRANQRRAIGITKKRSKK